MGNKHYSKPYLFKKLQKKERLTRKQFDKIKMFILKDYKPKYRTMFGMYEYIFEEFLPSIKEFVNGFLKFVIIIILIPIIPIIRFFMYHHENYRKFKIRTLKYEKYLNRFEIKK